MHSTHTKVASHAGKSLPTMYDLPSKNQEEFGLPELQIGLSLWEGTYEDISRLWLRWYDDLGNWILTPEEQQQQRAEQAEAKLAELQAYVQSLGGNPEQIDE